MYVHLGLCDYLKGVYYIYEYDAMHIHEMGCVWVCVCVCVCSSVVSLNQHALLPKYQFAIGEHSYIALEGN
jgi:hypothetical protein